jgi:hypothetical protein
MRAGTVDFPENIQSLPGAPESIGFHEGFEEDFNLRCRFAALFVHVLDVSNPFVSLLYLLIQPSNVPFFPELPFLCAGCGLVGSAENGVEIVH